MNENHPVTTSLPRVQASMAHALRGALVLLPPSLLPASTMSASAITSNHQAAAMTKRGISDGALS